MAKMIYSKAERTQQFISIGVKLAKAGGINAVSAAAIARDAEVSAPLVFQYFGNIGEIRRLVSKEARRLGIKV